MSKLNILVTRPAHQAIVLSHLIEQQGWNAIRFPTLEIIALEKPIEIIDHYHWLIFISANAVHFALKANDGKTEVFKQSAIAAVGKATEKALYNVGLSVDLIPKKYFNTEGLLATQAMHEVKGKSCLIIRGKGGREDLANSLRERGAIVQYREVYAREKPYCDNSNVMHLLQQGKLHAITITSGDGLRNLLAMISKALHNCLLSVLLIVMSQRIKVLAEQIGFKQIAVTESPDDAAMIKTLLTHSWGIKWPKM